MKVARIVLENFKQFKGLEIDVRNRLTEDVAEELLVLGDNGTGKTTVLQAVGLALSMAMGKTRSIDSFEWTGWLPGRYERWGTPVVELEVCFTSEENAATREVARRFLGSYAEELARNAQDGVLLPLFPMETDDPGDSPTVKLRLEGGRWTADRPEERDQFRGRLAAAKLLRRDPTVRDLFDRLPDVFWFDQFRNIGTTPVDSNGDQDKRPTVAFGIGVKKLREHLNLWQLNKLARERTAGRDFLQELETSYKKIFPGRSFSGPEPMYKDGLPTPSDYYFTLTDGERTYDIEEMSAGEQAVFPLLFEFVRHQIKNSVVLIDELDLNLHPPLAQSLLSALPTIGPSCQFLFTTHSEAVSSLVSPEQVFRLPGGRLCL